MQFEIDDKLIKDAVKSICSDAFSEGYNNRNPVGVATVRKQVHEYIQDVVADLLRSEIKRQAAALKKQGALL